MQESASHLDADLVVVNTCTVTHRADQQVRQAVRRLHRENPSAPLVLTGCYAERDPETLAALPGVSLIIGNSEKERLTQIIEERMPDVYGGFRHASCNPKCDSLVQTSAQTGGRTRPMIKIQDGCDARCSYCIVPHVRGPGRSVKPERVLAEIKSLIEQGFQEIILTGIHLGAFGHKLEKRIRLITLLRQIVKTPQLGRIRLSSIEPMQFERAIVDLAAKNPVFAHHFHIPVQSGSDRILRGMRRPYKAAQFQKLLFYIHEQLPDAGLGTDVLVGFPGETEQDFSATCKLIWESPLSYLHVFPFSPREGTDAWSLPGRIPSPVVKSRVRKLREMSRIKNLSFRRQFIGQVLPAITLAKEERFGTSVALTGNYIHAKILGRFMPPNRLVEIRIEDVRPDGTYARLS